MRTLEEHKFFPYIAWAIIILFSLFTLGLTNELLNTTASLDAYNDERMEQIHNLQKQTLSQ